MEATERERYTRLNNVRFPNSKGRPIGPNLSEQKKAEIVLAKNLQLMSHSMIAKEHGIARQTVVTLTEEKLSPEAKLHLKSFTEKLAEAREKTINRINEKLDNNDFKDGVYPNLLNAINSNYRLETNQPTTITSEQNSDKVAVAFSNLLKRKREQGHELPSDNELISLIESACKANNADVESVKARVLNSVETQ